MALESIETKVLGRIRKCGGGRFPVLIAAFCWLLSGCTDADYDLDKVDWTLGFGGQEVVLPTNNSTAEIQLDDLLDIGGSDFVRIDEATGDYILSKKPDTTVEPLNVNVAPITILENNSRGLSFDINLPDIPPVLQGQTITLPLTYPGLQQAIDLPEIRDKISLLEYEYHADEAVKSLDFVELGDHGQGVDLVVDVMLPKEIRKVAVLKIDMPDLLEMTCPSMPDQFDGQSNTLTLTDYHNNGPFQIAFNVKRAYVRTNDANNYVRLENDKFVLKTDVGIRLKIAELTIPSTPILTVSGLANFTDLTISGARGVFDPQIDLNEVGSVTINSLPTFLTEEEVVADIDNPQIWLTFTSTMPLGGTINAQITSDTHPTPIVLDPFEVDASSDGVTPVETKIVVCRRRPEGLPAGYKVVENDNLSQLIERLNEGMQLNFTVNSVRANQTPATIKLGHDYMLAPAYEFACPLAFGEKAVIVYTTTDNGWNPDIQRLNLADGAYVNLTATVLNKIPANLELDLIPLGTDGNELSRDVITIEMLKKDVAGARNEVLASLIEANISGDVSRLDGIKLKLKATSNEQLRGVTLNRSIQTLQLKDVTAKLVGKLIYDANKR